MKPRRIDAATRLSLAISSRLCEWRCCLTVVQPQTVIRWHRAGWPLFWRFKSRLGRPTIPADLRLLIRRMVSENPTWGQERIANELRLKLGIRPNIASYKQTPRLAGINSMVSLAYASNRYSVASTMSTIGRRRAFDSILADYSYARFPGFGMTAVAVIGKAAIGQQKSLRCALRFTE
jgi:hypothetical protein